MMAGPRFRSQTRPVGNKQQYELQDMQTLRRSSTGEGSIFYYTAHSEDSYEDRHHGHPNTTRGQQLDQGMLGRCKARTVEILWVCMGMFAEKGMTMLFMAFVMCVFVIFIILASRGLNPSPKSFDYGLEGSTGQAIEHAHPTMIITHSHTLYRIVKVYDKQFHDARPIHHQAPIALPSNLEPRDQTKLQDLTHPHQGGETFASVSGLYLMPMSITKEDWQQTQQDPYRPSRPASNTEFLQPLNPSLEKSEHEAKPAQHASKTDATRSLSARTTKADTNSFTRWGSEILYSLHRRIYRGVHLYKGWCIENVCSPPKQLDSICNTNNTTSNSFRKQECEWCWPLQDEKHIDKHCTKVSKGAVNTMAIICGIFLLCMLIMAILLLRRRVAAKARRCLVKHAMSASTLHEESNGAATHQNLHGISKFGRSSKATKIRVDDQAIKRGSPTEAAGLTPWYKAAFAKPEKRSKSSPENRASNRSRLQKQGTKPLQQEIAIGESNSHEKVPVLPPAPPAFSSRVFPDIENKDQGSVLSGAGTNNNQHDRQGRPRPLSRQSRAPSSGSEQSISQPTHRLNAGADVHNLHRLTERS